MANTAANLSRVNAEEWMTPPSLLHRFWEHMGERYGKCWYERYGADIPKAWRDSLFSMTPEEAQQGLKHMAAREDIYGLPTLSDFERSCVQALRANVPRSNTHKALPEPKTKRQERMSKASAFAKRAHEAIEKAGRHPESGGR